MMAQHCRHYPVFQRWMSLYMGLFVCLIFFFVQILPATDTFAAEEPNSEEAAPQNDTEPLYIIPDQSESVFKFGVSITPDQYIHSMNFSSYSPPINPLKDDFQDSRHADVSTVVRIALDEFKIFSGLNLWLQSMEKTMNGYTRKLMLTGEFNLDQKNADPVDYLEKVNIAGEIFKTDMIRPYRPMTMQSVFSQFEVNKVTWDIGVHLNSPLLLFKLGLGEAIVLHSSAGNDLKIGAMVTLTL